MYWTLFHCDYMIAVNGKLIMKNNINLSWISVCGLYGQSVLD